MKHSLLVILTALTVASSVKAATLGCAFAVTDASNNILWDADETLNFQMPAPGKEEVQVVNTPQGFRLELHLINAKMGPALASDSRLSYGDFSTRLGQHYFVSDYNKVNYRLADLILIKGTGASAITAEIACSSR